MYQVTDLSDAFAILSDSTIRRSKFLEKTWKHNGNQKRGHISCGVQQPYVTIHNRTSNRAVVFSSRILKYRAHTADLPTVWIPSDTFGRVYLVF